MLNRTNIMMGNKLLYSIPYHASENSFAILSAVTVNSSTHNKSDSKKQT